MAGNAFHSHPNPPDDYKLKTETSVDSIPSDDHFGMKKDSLAPSVTQPEKNCELSHDISALYGILALVAGICVVPLAEVVEDFDADVLRWFESMNMLVAIGFLVYCFAFLFHAPTTTVICGPAGEIPEAPSLFDLAKLRFRRLTRTSAQRASMEDEVCVRVMVGGHHVSQQAMDSGSLYLKVGCVIFAVGSLVYLSMLFGIFAENPNCFGWVMGVNPVMVTVFVSLQLMFIFKNSQFTITKYKAVGRLGLMHLVVVNLLICLRVIVDETVHSFAELAEEHEVGGNHSAAVDHLGQSPQKSGESAAAGGTGAYLSSCISDASIMKSALESSTVFLYPCIIEYALICAGIIFTMWRGMANSVHVEPVVAVVRPKGGMRGKLSGLRARKAFRINCESALGGMFAGLLVISGVLVGLVIFFMAKSNPEWNDGGTLTWQIMDLGLLCLGFTAAVYCVVQFTRKLDRFEFHSINMELDDSLLMFSMIGVYAYCITSLLGTSRSIGTKTGRLSVACNSLTMIQATLQTIFLFDAGKRRIKPPLRGRELEAPKPGRQMVTFLLIVNFALWAVNVFCTLRIDGTPSQIEFYGPQLWTVITHLTVPLIIFYRFHSTACIFEVWKKAYREPKDLLGQSESSRT